MEFLGQGGPNKTIFKVMGSEIKKKKQKRTIGKRPGNNRKKAGNNWKKAWRQKLFLGPKPTHT
jgi:hypothetical protein